MKLKNLAWNEFRYGGFIVWLQQSVTKQTDGWRAYVYFRYLKTDLDRTSSSAMRVLPIRYGSESLRNSLRLVQNKRNKLVINKVDYLPDFGLLFPMLALLRSKTKDIGQNTSTIKLMNKRFLNEHKNQVLFH